MEEAKQKAKTYFPKCEIKRVQEYETMYEIQFEKYIVFINKDLTLNQIIHTGYH